MTGKTRLYISLLVLGLVVIGGGIWILVKSPPRIDIPQGSPVIYERLDYVMRGQFDYLYIYGDGSIIYIEEKGLRLSGGHPTRTWKTGQLRAGELDQLIGLFQSSQFAELDNYYQFPGKSIEGGGFTIGDGSFTFTINYGDLQKTVTAFGYLTPDNGETYPDMPAPLNEIYGRLRAIAMATEEVYTEAISG